MEYKTFIFNIFKFNSEVDKKPYIKEYKLKVLENSNMMLLDALEKIRDEQDSSLTFRRACGQGVCGSDGMNVNGKNILACITNIFTLNNPINIKPLPSFPVERDLIVDMTNFYKQYDKIKPFFENDQVAPNKERLQSPEERKKLDGLYECIMCACCTSSCPSYWWNPDKFIGPAGLLQASRFVSDSRDTDKEARLEKLEDPFSLFRCRSIMNCASACPKNLNPTKAIETLRKDLIKSKI